MRLLGATGMRRLHYLPITTRVCWRLGLQIPPPHFRSFGANAISAVPFFAGVMGFFLVAFHFVSLSPSTGWVVAILYAVFATVAGGLCMGGIYAHERRRHQLPAWGSLISHDRP